MNVQLITVALALCDIASNPRSRRDPAYVRSLGENIKAVGQKVPIIGFYRDGRFIVSDGGCRVEGMRGAGLTDAIAMDLGKEPSEADLLMAQAAIDLHKQHLPPVDRGRLFDSIIKARGITARQAAQELAVSESLVSRHRDLLKLAPDLQEQVNTGVLDSSKAFVIAREPDFAKQRELAAAAAGITCEEFRAKVTKGRGDNKPAVRQSRVVCPLTTGTKIVVTGPAMDLEGLIDALQAALDCARKASRDQIDVKTAERVWKDKAKGGASGRAPA